MRLSTFLPVLLIMGPSSFATLQAAPLAAHHAVYRLALDRENPGRASEVSDAHGTMTYDMVDTCGAWATSQHLVIDLTKDGQDVHMVSDYATLESKDGTHLDFHSKQVTDTAVTERLDGSAVLDRPGGHGRASFTAPETKQVELAEGTLLPTAHTAALLDAATAGKKFFAAPLFDGTSADGAQNTFVTVESWQAPFSESRRAPLPNRQSSVAKTEVWPGLSALPYGRVHIAFFDQGRATETPDYEIGMIYFYNGVADALTMDFEDFKLTGKLDGLALHPTHC